LAERTNLFLNPNLNCVCIGRKNDNMGECIDIRTNKLDDGQKRELAIFIYVESEEVTDVSSTKIRNFIQDGKDISDLTYEVVREYLVDNNIYYT